MEQPELPVAFFAIDPGKNGALAIVPPVLHIETRVFDLDTSDPVAVVELLTQQRTLWTCRLLLVEEVHAMPRQGVTSMFSMGRSLGVIHGVATALQIPWMPIIPQRWQKLVTMPKDGATPKERSMAAAKRTFPHMTNLLRAKSHAGRADALMLGWYGVMTLWRDGSEV